MGETSLNGGWRLPASRRRPALWAACLVVIVVAWCLFVGLSSAHDPLARQQLPAAARSFASSLFLIAGVVRLMRWRLADDLGAGRAALALLVLGAAVRVHPLVGDPLTLAQPNPAVHTLCLAAVFALLLPAVGQSDPRRHILIRLTWAVVAVGAVSSAVIAVRDLWPAGMPVLWVSVDCAGAIGWLALATRSWRSADRTRRPTEFWLCTAMVFMAAGEWALASSMAGNATMTGITPGLQLAASGLAALVSLTDLRQTFTHDDLQTADATRVFNDMQRQFDEARLAQLRRLHDAKSAIVGVIAASNLLTTQAITDSPDRVRLGHLMVHELHRLQAVLDPDGTEPISEFDLVDAIGPVVLIHQLDGRVIRTDLNSLPVIGRPRATATVLDNLLRNARMHAPGASVAVHVNRSGAVVSVVVEDDGPGVPPTERERVLGAGVRGSAASAPGSGLGLFNAVTAMRAQGGTLELTERSGGGTRVTLTLPAARDRCDAHALVS
ncbi:MAG: HAMP domain-containing sensor histidine kinase [Jatrophihabitantaceae bacterium]